MPSPLPQGAEPGERPEGPREKGRVGELTTVGTWEEGGEGEEREERGERREGKGRGEKEDGS